MKRALLQLHTAVFLAGFTAVLGKLIHLQEAWLVWYRLLFTILIMAAWYFFRKEVKLIPKKDMLQIFLVGFLVALHWVAFFGSVKYSNVSISLVCFATISFFTAITEPLITGRKIIFAELLFGLISLAGIYIIFDFNPQYKTGIIFGLISALTCSFFSIFNSQMLKKHTPRTLNFYEITAAFIWVSLMLPVYLLYFPASYSLPTLPDLFLLAILSGLCTVVAIDLQLNALRRTSAFTVNLAYNLEPAYGILMAFVFLDEAHFFGPSFYVGVSIVMISVLLHTIRIFAARKRLMANVRG